MYTDGKYNEFACQQWQLSCHCHRSTLYLVLAFLYNPILVTFDIDEIESSHDTSLDGAEIPLSLAIHRANPGRLPVHE